MDWRERIEINPAILERRAFALGTHLPNRERERAGARRRDAFVPSHA